jgi:hypothetical protein
VKGLIFHWPSYTTRKRLITGAPKSTTASAPEPDGGNRPVVMAYRRRTSRCASSNTSYPRHTRPGAPAVCFLKFQKKEADLDLDLDQVRPRKPWATLLSLLRRCRSRTRMRRRPEVEVEVEEEVEA